MFRFSLEPAPPFRLDLTAWAIRRRPINEIDRWNGQTYERVLAVSGTPTLVSVSQTGDAIEVRVSGARGTAAVKQEVTRALERVLGLWIDLQPFYDLARKCPRLNELAERFRGLKPPRFPTVWEAIVNAIACQQLSLTVGLTVLNRLAAEFGAGFGGRRAFPAPDALAAATPAALRSIGFSGAKARALIELAREILAGRLDLESLAELESPAAVARLVQLRGVGRWSAEYTLLRGLGRIDVFPGDDVGARNNLARWMRLRTPLDYEYVGRVVAKWRPYAGLIYFHLLLDGIAKAGYLDQNLSTRSCVGRPPWAAAGPPAGSLR